VGDVFGEYTFEMSTPEDQHPVKALPTHSADESMGPWTSNRGTDDLDSISLEGFVEAGGESCASTTRTWSTLKAD